MIRPVDMQVLIPKTNEVARAEQMNVDKHGNQQMQFAQQMEKQVILESQQVIETGKSENTAINKDGGQKNTSQQKRNRRNKNKKEEEKDAKTASTSLFDMKV